MLVPVKFILLVGEPGSRVDFVGGWLSTLGNFINSHWNISVTTGQSNGIMSSRFKSLNNGKISISDVLKQNNYVLDSQAPQWLIGTCHNLLPNQITELSNYSDSMSLAVIDTTNVPRQTIRWEFIVKTYLNKDYLNKLGNNEECRESCKRLLKFDDTNGIYNYNHIPGIQLEYSKLFVPGGSIYLCDQLNVNASERHHEYWNSLLPFVSAPDEIDCYDYHWTKQDCECLPLS